MLKTSFKSLALVTALFGTGGLMAQNCNTSAWGQDLTAGQGVAGTPLAGSPAASVSRYSGRCGLLSDAPGDFVRDGSPLNEPTYIARFYVRPAVTTGTARIFEALEDGQGTPSISVDFTGTTFALNARGAVGTTVPALTGRWYAIEVNWTAGGAMTYTIRGAAATTAVTGTLTGVTAGAQVDQANLGWISGGSGGTVTTDAFESRRTQPIGRLCRGDADGSGVINIFDVGTVTNERVNAVLAAGQVDCDENGTINVFDVGCVTNLRLNGPSCATQAGP